MWYTTHTHCLYVIENPNYDMEYVTSQKMFFSERKRKAKWEFSYKETKLKGLLPGTEILVSYFRNL